MTKTGATSRLSRERRSWSDWNVLLVRFLAIGLLGAAWPSTHSAAEEPAVGSRVAVGTAVPQTPTNAQEQDQDVEKSPLQQLAWLVGRWSTPASDKVPPLAGNENGSAIDDSRSPPVPATAVGRWSDDGHFLLLDYALTPPNAPTIAATERIAWDPVAKGYRSWTFRHDGGFGEAAWVKRDNGWLIRYTGTTGAGESFSSTLLLVPGTEGNLQLSAIERWIGDTQVPDMTVVLTKNDSTPSREPIEGVVWELQSLGTTTIRGKNRPNLALASGQVQAFGGINRIAGRYQLSETSLRFSAMMSTLMGGPEAESELEQAFSEALEQVTQAKVVDGVLILSSDEKELARFAKADRTPREDKAPQMSFNEALGKTWVLAELNGAAINVMEPPSLTFSEERVEGYSGVNRLGGSYERVESRLTFGPIRSTRRAGSPDQMKLENEFMKLLKDVDGFDLTAQQLSLLVGKEVVAKFVLETP